MRFESILFDLDGTLTDSSAAITRSIAHVMRILGHEPPPASALIPAIGPPIRDTFKQLLATDDLALIERATALYVERYAIHGALETQPYPRIEEALDRLRKSGIRLFVATSKMRDNAVRVLSALAMAAYFEAIYGSMRDGSLAFKEELIPHIALEEGLDPAATAMVGDREHDVRGGKSARLFTVGVTWGYGSREELAGADAIVDTVEELWTVLTD